jgi:putative methyltransferase (TIGR04325 family)
LASQNKRFIANIVSDENAYLPLIASIISSDRNPVNILDFGGGMGISFIHLLSCAPNADAIHYYIVENSAVVALGRQLFPNSKIHFLTELPSQQIKFNLVYLSSSLQYIENYSALIDKLCQYQPEYILFVKLSAGEIPTYATCQRNLGGTKIAYWFLNVFEIEAILNKNGYSLIFKNALGREYNQDNFPENYRLHKAINLLFRKNAE